MLAASDIRVDFDGAAAVAGASLSVARGETVAVLGPSGCGKSTLLRVIAGLQRPETGRVVVAGRDVTDVPAHRRGIGLMLQGDALFPHRSVAQNVGFGLRVARRPRREIEQRVDELLDIVGLKGFGNRSIAGLSGGESQRVALARTLAPRPALLLLDEPLAALDRPLHERLLRELRQLFDRLGVSVVYVTHDVAEAFALGHRVAVMREGRIVQIAEPDALWSRPADGWTARFLGLVNVHEHGGVATVTRPEAVILGSTGHPAHVVSAERQGSLVRIRVRLDAGGELEAATTALRHPLPGDPVRVQIDQAGVVEMPARVLA